jgi:DNA sulfur modification protein DndB
MIDRLYHRSEMKGLARRQARPDVWSTVPASELEAHLEGGWEVRRKNKRSVALRQAKDHAALLRSRVWSLLYRMGFSYISDSEGAVLQLDRGADGPAHSVDCLAVDDEVAVAAYCRSSLKPRRDSRFEDTVAAVASVRGRLARATAQIEAENRTKRAVATVVFLNNYLLTDSDSARAEAEQVRLFDEQDLEYYEELVKHLGPAARYQFLSEVFRGRAVKGLEVRVPALRTKVGRQSSYTFSLRPDYLLKIAYIAHRAKGKPFDIDAYQRMISKGRLASIAEFISAGGVFPTNIVVNVENPRHVRFERMSQESDGVGAEAGWLTITPAYGAVWIIDGQHRLFAYSGHDRAKTSFLNVLAFEGLSPADQTNLFVDINSEQRRVKRSLLVELDATLKWNDDDEDKRIHAIVSKAGMALDTKQGSPLRGRVLLADARRTKKRCVSLTAIAGALRKPGFFMISRKTGQVTQYGPLWRDEPTDCLRRTVLVLEAWLGTVAQKASGWWDLGAEEGGGLSMNDGVTVCIEVLRAVLEHLDAKGTLVLLEDSDLASRLEPWAAVLGDHFGRMSAEERATFRGLRGVQGQTTGRMMALQSIASRYPQFEPEGLNEWVERRKLNTNESARRIIDRMERAIQSRVLEELRAEFRADESDWWFSGVPMGVRKKVDDRINEIGGGKREANFDLMHYEAIMHFKWELFKSIFAYGDRTNVGKEKATSWLREIGDMRNKVMHPSRNDYLSVEELEKLEMYEEWLNERLRATASE